MQLLGMSGSFANNPSQKISVFPTVRKSTPPVLTTTTKSASTAAASSNSISPTSFTVTATISTKINNTTSLQPLSTLPPISNINNTSIPTNNEGVDGGGGDGGRHLSAGAIAGIVIGTLFIFAMIAFMVVSAIRCRQKNSSASHYPLLPPSSTFRSKRKRSLPRGVGGGEKNFTSTDFITTPPVTTTYPIIHAITTNTATAAVQTSTTTTSQLTTSASISQLPAPPPISNNNIYTVISSYTQTLDDELYIQVGDQIQIVTKYDDGWCLGINLTRGSARGVFPQHCCNITI